MKEPGIHFKVSSSSPKMQDNHTNKQPYPTLSLKALEGDLKSLKIEPISNAKSEHSTFCQLLKSPIPTNILGCAINVKSLHPLSNINNSEGVMVDILRVIGPHIIAVKHNFNVGNPPNNFIRTTISCMTLSNMRGIPQIEIDKFLQNTFIWCNIQPWTFLGRFAHKLMEGERGSYCIWATSHSSNVKVLVGGWRLLFKVDLTLDFNFKAPKLVNLNTFKMNWQQTYRRLLSFYVGWEVSSYMIIPSLPYGEC